MIIYYVETEEGFWKKYVRKKWPVLPIWKGPLVDQGIVTIDGRPYSVNAEDIRDSPDGKFKYILIYRPDAMSFPLLGHREGVPNADIIRQYAASQRLSRVMTPKNQNEKLVLYLVVALIGTVIGALAVVAYVISRMKG